MKGFDEIFNSLINKIETIKNEFVDKKELLTKHYAENYLKYYKPQNYGQPERFAFEDFDQVFNYDISFLEEQNVFLKIIRLISLEQENKLTAQMCELIELCVTEMNNVFFNGFYSDLLFHLYGQRNFAKAYQSIIILSQFSSISQNIVIIGGNGSGKTTLANILKGNDKKNMAVVPAQKTLFFTLNDTSLLTTRRKDLEDILLENNILRSKEGNDYGYFSFQNNQFTKLIIAMKEQHFQYLNLCYEKRIQPIEKESIFGRLKDIFTSLFPDILLSFQDTPAEYFTCVKNGEQFHVNALSEGEKAVIYYTLSILMAKDNSLIVVDEPETYLNPSLANTLWDILIEYRRDCQFIFITHSVNFVLGRNDVKVAWIKHFDHPDSFSFEFIDDSFTLPKNLLTEVLGSLKPILFCEGDSKNSLDYKVYQSIFKKHYTVIPVGGYHTVIQYVKVINDSAWLGMECFGVIDGDNYTEERIQELRANNIIVLPFNEIEMFILSDDILQFVLGKIYPESYSQRIDQFKDRLWQIVEENKDKIVLDYIKKITDEHVQSYTINSYDTLEEITQSLNGVSSFDLKQYYNLREQELDRIIKTKDYEQLLVVCNLKKKISKELANSNLDTNYEVKAIQQITNYPELKVLLKQKYFGEL